MLNGVGVQLFWPVEHVYVCVPVCLCAFLPADWLIPSAPPSWLVHYAHARTCYALCVLYSWGVFRDFLEFESMTHVFGIYLET